MTRTARSTAWAIALLAASAWTSRALACGRDGRLGPEPVGNTLAVVKAGDDLLLQWTPAPGVGTNGGHHVDQVFDKQDIHDAPSRGDRMVVVETEAPPPPPGPSIEGAVPKVAPPSFPIEVVYYQVVGVCCDKVTEGLVD